ncbi:MAG: hypothetical protein ACI9S8_000664 [Chlamydiales bacterium]|jgi:hypothetical protein
MGYRKNSERLLTFQQAGMLNMDETEVNALVTAYNKALRWYHLSQINYEKSGENKRPIPEVTTTSVDPTELREMTEVIHLFSQKQSLFL